ncbi:MAG: NAD(P)/FAD-dependent oxidoreductase [Ferruginibacter sp.]
MKQKHLVVTGGGAAGFFCAVNAAAMCPDLRVTIVEKSGKLLGKVKVSGGGRCNVTHACFSIAEMVKRYPRGASFLKKAFHHFFTTDTIQWFRERGVELKTETDGRMFPVTDSSQTIIDCLMREANTNHVQVLMNREVDAVVRENNHWHISFKNASPMEADFVCVASGGYAKAQQFDWLRNVGHTIETPVPSLFTFNMPGNSITALMGVSVANAQVKISASKLQSEGPLLITHWGMSGPAILKLSAWAARELAAKQWQCKIVINWLPEYNENSLRTSIQQLRFDMAAQKIYNRNPFGLPARLWDYLLKESGIAPEIRWADLPAKAQNKLIKYLCAHEFEVKGKTTFKEEFVTAGGISLAEVDHLTMQSKKASGLYFAGEVLDVDGVTGGFNFQNAWTTGWIAAKAIAESVLAEGE